MDLISLPAGAVVVSDRRTQRSWEVAVAAFEIAAVPVTRAVFEGSDRFVGEGDEPVVGVSWWDAIRFCNELSQRDGLTPVYDLERAEAAPADGYRLPTEAEWEYACRAGTTGPRYGELGEIAWYEGNSGGRIHAVAEKLPNAWGLYDTLGNTWDWCWDLYDPAVYGTYRVLRGGGWADAHWSCRASVRRRSHPTFRIDDVGFRLARSRC